MKTIAANITLLLLTLIALHVSSTAQDSCLVVRQTDKSQGYYNPDSLAYDTCNHSSGDNTSDFYYTKNKFRYQFINPAVYIFTRKVEYNTTLSVNDIDTMNTEYFNFFNILQSSFGHFVFRRQVKVDDSDFYNWPLFTIEFDRYVSLAKVKKMFCDAAYCDNLLLPQLPVYLTSVENENISDSRPQLIVTQSVRNHEIVVKNISGNRIGCVTLSNILGETLYQSIYYDSELRIDISTLRSNILLLSVNATNFYMFLNM